MANEELQSLYKTSAEMVKHFNSILDKARIIVVTVGLMVFASAGKIFLDDGTRWLPMAISLFGCVFVASMGIMARHYLMHTEGIVEAAKEVEEKLMRICGTEKGTFANIIAAHNGKKGFWYYAYNYGTFIVMEAGCVVMFIISVEYFFDP